MGICERMMRIDAPADVVWAWLSDPRNLFGVDVLHAAVRTDEPELRAGALVPIDYDVFGLYRQRHQARIRNVQPYFVAFAVDRGPGADGRDPFPHCRSLRVVPLDPCACVLVNCVAGHFTFPGAAIVGEPLFRRCMPALLDDYNQHVAVGCGAMAPGQLRRPAGLVGLLVAASARLRRRSTRAEMLEQMKTDRAMAYRATAQRGSGAVDGPAAVPIGVAGPDAPVGGDGAVSLRADDATERATPR